MDIQEQIKKEERATLRDWWFCVGFASGAMTSLLIALILIASHYG